MSILVDKNKESWLVIEKDNVIRVFTNKNSAVQYRSNNKDKVTNVLHRYSDGTMQPLLHWPGEETSGDNAQLAMSQEDFDQIYNELEDIQDKDRFIDFYELCASNNGQSDVEDTPEEE